MKLSIITIAYNNANGLDATLKSVMNQTVWSNESLSNEVEQIVIDGASKDNSVDIIHYYEDNIPNFSYVSEPDNGVYDAMNKGILMAKGDYCLFLNSGDVLYADSVLVEILSQQLNADIICGNALYLKSNYHPADKKIISPMIISASRIILDFLPHQASLIRRQLFSDIHLYDITYRVVSDWLFYIEALLVHHVTYEHLQMFISRCETEGISSNPANNELMEREFHIGLKSVLPLYYDDYCELKRAREVLKSNKYVLFDHLNNKDIFNILFKIQRVLHKIGWYKFKKKYKEKRFYSQLQREDNEQKKIIERNVGKLPSIHNRIETQSKKTGFVVSLTSYGKRVCDALPYALYSLLTQTIVPDKIVVYLDNEHWNHSNLPKILLTFEDKGVEYRFVEDIKSYKKLIPALIDFPNNPIVTVDDDFYYNRSLIEWLYRDYKLSDQKTVIGSWGCIVTKVNGKYRPYSEWTDCKYGNVHSEYSLFAGNGTVYPPHIFDKEILKSDVFLNIAPTADDIWFWVMEKRQNISVKLIKEAKYGLHRPVNRIETYDHSQSKTLFYVNCINGKNDEQLSKLIDKYMN